MPDRGPDRSEAYIRDLFLDDNSKDMSYDVSSKCWTADIKLKDGATKVDFFSNHRKTIRHGSFENRNYLPAPTLGSC